ncbi:hypothetical protein E1287_12425 [Actinomadura sp. KC06]|uniref:hypothetical protein n=1 Tax=Actinomadura sp. KC06 TaxID=2530369 RepID=UPI0010433E66|nr:hypothetical protein [Actinomadura sp. KC06]TDD35970.1 hypothetical protein E1287_12425 [Actinomadura sp. KC06]
MGFDDFNLSTLMPRPLTVIERFCQAFSGSNSCHRMSGPDTTIRMAFLRTQAGNRKAGPETDKARRVPATV